MMPPVIPVVLDRHAEEAAFLWLLRDRAVDEPHFKLFQLTELDARVEAHVDGLRVAGDVGWDIVLTALIEGGASEVYPAALLALEDGDAGKIQAVLNSAKVPLKARAAVSAIGWLPAESAARHIRPLLNSNDPALKQIGIGAAAVHRLALRDDVLLGACASDDTPLKARVLRAIGELGRLGLLRTVRAYLGAADPACRFWAAWSAALLAEQPDAVAVLRDIAESGGPFAERAAAMAMRRLTPRDGRVWLKRLVRDLAQVRTALVAAGALADPEAVPFLIDRMKVPALARVAGESFSLITGADIVYDKLEGFKPEGFEAGPTDHPEDENVEIDPDGNLPWPDQALIQKWWSARQGNLAKGTRYLLGRPITPESLRLALMEGYQRQRAAAALELAILMPGRPLFEVRAPGFRQQAMLGKPEVSRAND